jgi:glycosyltransferase involved in cell wall biosynthesis
VASVHAQTRQVDQLVVETDEERTGAAQTRNRGLSRVRDDIDLIAWLDDDDALLPNHIERLTRVLERAPDIDLVYPIPRIVGGRDPTAVAVNGLWIPPWRVPFGPEQEQHLRDQGSFIPITHMVRAAKVREIGGFPMPGTTRWIEDWGYLVNLLDAGARFYHLPVKTWVWNIHPDPAMHTGGSPDRAGRVWGN